MIRKRVYDKYGVCRCYRWMPGIEYWALEYAYKVRR